MKPRRAVSLVEVLVAAVLLMLGVGGTLQAIATAAQLRNDADRREALVGLLLDRLAWFEGRACAVGDTSGVTRLPDGPEARWAVEAVGEVRVLRLDGARRGGNAARRTQIVTSRLCG